MQNAWQWSPWGKDELKITVVDFCQLPYGFIHVNRLAYLNDAEAISFSPARHCERGSAATEKESLMLCWVDAACANWVDDSFTGGFLIGLAPARILEGHEVNTSLMHWASQRVRHLCRSSLAAEVQALARTKTQTRARTSSMRFS